MKNFMGQIGPKQVAKALWLGVILNVLVTSSAFSAFGFGNIASQIQAAVAAQAAAAAVTAAAPGPLNYNTVISISPSADASRNFWTLPNYQNAAVAGAHEIIVGPNGDPRQTSGVQLYILRKQNAPESTGPVQYGDTVEILSCANWSGSQAISYTPNPYMFAVRSPSRWQAKNGDTRYSDFAILPLNENDPSRLLTIQSSTGATGPVMQGSGVYFSQGKLQAWVYGDNRWGSQYWEVLLGDPATDGRIASGRTLYVKSAQPNSSYQTTLDAANTWIQSQIASVVPAGWSQEGEGAELVAVGSDNGQTMAWMIQIVPDAQGQQNGVLYQYQNGSMAPNPWTAVTANDANGNPIPDFVDVSAASDGTVCAVSAIGQVVSGGTVSTAGGAQTTTGGTVSATGGIVYKYDKKANHWVALTTKNDQKKATIMFDGVAVGNEKNIWATEANTTNCYQLVNDEWVLRSKDCVDVSVGRDGAVYATNPANKVYAYITKNNIWSQIMYKDASGATQPLQLTQVSIGSANYAYGINNTNGTNDLWVWNKATQNWSRPLSTAGTPARGFVSVSCNAAGTVLAADNSDTIWISDKGGVTDQGQPSGKVSKRTDAKNKGEKKAGGIAKITKVSKAAIAGKVSKKAKKKKDRNAAVAKAKTVSVNGKPVKVDSTGKVIQKASKVVGKKARAAKIAATKAAATTTAKPGKATKAAANKIRAAQPAGPAQKTAMKKRQ